MSRKKTTIEFDDDVEPVEPVETTETTIHAVEGDESDEPTAPTIINTPEPIPSPATAERRHQLDDAPIHSKIVKTLDGAWLARPDDQNGPLLLPKTDIASRLPDGARIQKMAEGKFRGQQLSPAGGPRPDLLALTAMEAIRGFVPHFHDGEAVR